MDTDSHLPILQQTFGYSQFHPIQEKVIRHVLAGDDALLILPTGGGKSLCYQFPAVVSTGTCIVISPLIALMHDQVSKLKLNGIAAGMLNSSLSAQEYDETLALFRQNQLRLLFVAPERWNTEHFQALIKQVTISFVAIDEAHCLSEWGHDFRVDYRQLHIKTLCPNTPIIALTATATTKVAKDICEQLNIPDTGVFRQSVFRPNLSIKIEKRTSHYGQRLIDFIGKQDHGQGIIYAQTRKKTDSLCDFLQQHNIAALPYHAGLSNEQRHHAYRAFVEETVQVVVATIAFGMGIDKNNIRFVVHAHLPKSIENYYQEIGRAGRDGLPAHTLLLFGDGDAIGHRRFAEDIEDADFRQQTLDNLEIVKTFAYSEQCRHQYISQYFDDAIVPCASQCDACLTADAPRMDITMECQLFLSAIYRMRSRFGKTYVVDVICGSRQQKILNNGHDQLPLYGKGNHISKATWDNVCNRLLDIGAIAVGEYQVLQLQATAKPILAGEQTITMKQTMADVGQTQELDHSDTAYNHDCLNALKTLRRTLAGEANLPAYLIFDDKTLRAMASSIPHSEAEFLQIDGVGAVKLERFGSSFINLLQQYPQPQQQENELAHTTVKTTTKPLGETYRTTLAAINQGLSLQEITDNRALAFSTILGHVNKLVHSNDITHEKRLELFATVHQADDIKAWIAQGLQHHSIQELQTALSIHRQLHDAAQ